MKYIIILFIGFLLSYFITYLSLSINEVATMNPFKRSWWIKKVNTSFDRPASKIKFTMFEHFLMSNIAYWIIILCLGILYIP